MGSLGFGGFLIKTDPLPGTPSATGGLWRPPQWSGQSLKTLMTVVLPQQGTAPNGSQNAAPTSFYFDAVFEADHDLEYQPTKHPVQVGAAITDHVYKLPAIVVLSIGMSDLMDSFIQGQYSGNTSKSVAAFQQFQQIADLGLPVTLSTRLATYTQMVIKNIRVRDDRDTLYALKAFITFWQIIPAKVSTATFNTIAQGASTLPLGAGEGSGIPSILPQSARDMDTDLTNLGTKTADDPTQAVTSTFQVPPFFPGTPGADVPGAGDWSSNNVNLLPSH